MLGVMFQEFLRWAVICYILSNYLRPYIPAGVLSITLNANESGVDCTNSALIVFDMQHGIASRAFNIPQVTANVKLLIDTVHYSHRPVIFSMHTGLPFESQSKYAIYSMRRRGLDPKTQVYMAEGTPEWEMVSDLAPAKGDLVLKKHTPSFFIGTMLELLLRNKGVDTVIITGVSTDIGIEATARHAAYLGFLPIVVEDAIGSSDRARHDASLLVMRSMFPLWKTAEVTKSFEGVR